MYHRNTMYTMDTEKAKAAKSTPVRISTNNKERLAKVVRKKADSENRYVTETEVADELLEMSLPRLERKYKI